MDKFSTNMPWVMFYLLDGQFAVSSDHVREMVAMPKVVTVPQTPDYIRGVIKLRDQVIPVMDLRLKMGFKSLIVETGDIVQLLAQREQDHKDWIGELESSVQERREFKLSTDHHQCAFGKWHDSFKTDNRLLSSCLAKFYEPHEKIHSIAIKVKAMEEKEDYDAAYEIINRTKKGELAEMIRLFSEMRALLSESSREIALVLEWEEKTMVISVDSVATVERLEMSNIENMPEVTFTTDNECIDGIGKRGKDNELVQLLNVGKLIGKEKELVNEISRKESALSG